jgi:hypothetical protein
MYNNPDWDMASRRLTAFWHKEIIDRPCLQVYARTCADISGLPDHGKTEKEISEPYDLAELSEYSESSELSESAEASGPSEPHASRESMSAWKYWTDPQVFLRTNRNGYANTAFLGEALPVLYPNAEHVAMAMGSALQYSPDTIWIHRTPGKLEDLDFSGVTPASAAIEQMAGYFRHLAASAQGECFVGFPHMGNPGDTLARMRGYDTFCMDLLDNPEYCFLLEDQILRIWKMSYDMLFRIINEKMPGSCGWLPAWHPGKCALVEFDFCALISPDHFHQYLPYLIDRATYAEHAIFHLDGPGALKHLDTLLSIKEIGFIQWEPGAGEKNIFAWIPLMQKIQAAGKGLYVSGGPFSIGQARALLKELKPEGLMMPVVAESASEAASFLESTIISH